MHEDPAPHGWRGLSQRPGWAREPRRGEHWRIEDGTAWVGWRRWCGDLEAAGKAAGAEGVTAGVRRDGKAAAVTRCESSGGCKEAGSGAKEAEAPWGPERGGLAAGKEEAVVVVQEDPEK